MRPASILEQYPEQRFQQLFERHHREYQRHDRQKCRSHELKDDLLCNRREAHCPHDVKTVGHIGERLNVGAAHQRLIGRHAAAHPLGIELAHVTLSQRAILAIALPLRAGQLRRKHQERAEHHTQYEDDEDSDLGFELRQRGPDKEKCDRR
jgi:hypothetical protein